MGSVSDISSTLNSDPTHHDIKRTLGNPDKYLNSERVHLSVG